MAKLEVRLVLRCDGVEVIYTHKELGGRSVHLDAVTAEHKAHLQLRHAREHLRALEAQSPPDQEVQIESSLELFDLTLCELVVVSVAR
jgi:hypothetical protein